MAFGEAKCAEALNVELFAGSWLSVGEGDGIARSGDPVANRRGITDLGLPDNLDDLVARAAEFDCLLVCGHDLWAADADKAAKLLAIPQRIVLSSWLDATASAATQRLVYVLGRKFAAP